MLCRQGFDGMECDVVRKNKDIMTLSQKSDSEETDPAWTGFKNTITLGFSLSWHWHHKPEVRCSQQVAEVGAVLYITGCLTESLAPAH